MVRLPSAPLGEFALRAGSGNGKVGMGQVLVKKDIGHCICLPIQALVRKDWSQVRIMKAPYDLMTYDCLFPVIVVSVTVMTSLIVFYK